MSTKREQIALRARKHKDAALHNLHGFIDESVLIASYMNLNKTSSSGVDGETWESYGKELLSNLKVLLERFRTGKYNAPNIRRVYIDKEGGKKRALGIPTIEDKVLQSAVNMVLEPIYEEEFKNFSYGFRKGHSQHQAIDYLFKEVSFGKIGYLIDADITNFFGELNHGQLRKFLDHRIKDGVIRKMIDKWLKAGIVENGELTYPKEGSPQGSVISPLLSNIYLHYVLDTWFNEMIQPRLRGRSMIVRFADDFVLGFKSLNDAKRVLSVLKKRLNKYGLDLHSEKTKLIDLENKEAGMKRSFDFLGFTHYQGRSNKGYKVLKRKTSHKKLSKSIHEIGKWIKLNRHKKLKDLIGELNVKLRGYYNYYGITFNYVGLQRYYSVVCMLLRKWLNRRGGKKHNWDYYNKLLVEWCPVLKPKVYNSIFNVKP